MDRKQVKEKARYAFIREKANQIQEKSRHKYSVPGAFTVIGRARDIKQYGSDTEESNSATDSLERATISAAHRVLRSARYAKRKKNTFLDETNYDRDLGSENKPDAGPDPTGMRFTVKRISEEDNISASPQKLMREEAVNDYKAQIHQKRYDASMSETDIPPYKEKADRPYIKTRETTQARHTSSQVASRHIQPSGSKAQELKAQAVREQGRRLARNTSIKQSVHKQSRRDSALRKMKAAMEQAARSSARSALLAGSGFLLLLLPLLLLFGAAGALFGSSADIGNAPVSDEVKSYAGLIQIYAMEHGILEYAELIAAVMMQESGGQGGDPMQASECAFNTKYPKTPGSITDPEYSINIGIRNLADCLSQAEAEDPADIERISLALQGYNFGSGYISWAMHNYGGYSELNALEFSEMMAQRMGWTGYGDPQYVQHVMRYYGTVENILERNKKLTKITD